MRQKLGRLTAGLLLSAWMIVIFCFSAQPAEESSEISGTISYRLVSATDQILHMQMSEPQLIACAYTLEHPVRKAAHMTEYAILGLLALLFIRSFPVQRKTAYRAALAAAFAYACTDEIHQLFVPGRAGQLRDVCIDTAGALVMLVLMSFLEKKIRKRCEKCGLPLQ